MNFVFKIFLIDFHCFSLIEIWSNSISSFSIWIKNSHFWIKKSHSDFKWTITDNSRNELWILGRSKRDEINSRSFWLLLNALLICTILIFSLDSWSRSLSSVLFWLSTSSIKSSFSSSSSPSASSFYNYIHYVVIKIYSKNLLS